MATEKHDPIRITVEQVRQGQYVRPEEDWEAYNASVSCQIRLNPKKGYKVEQSLVKGWLQLEPDDSIFATTTVFVYFKDPGRLVELFEKKAKVGKKPRLWIGPMKRKRSFEDATNAVRLLAMKIGTPDWHWGIGVAKHPDGGYMVTIRVRGETKIPKLPGHIRGVAVRIKRMDEIPKAL